MTNYFSPHGEVLQETFTNSAIENFNKTLEIIKHTESVFKHFTIEIKFSDFKINANPEFHINSIFFQ